MSFSTLTRLWNQHDSLIPNHFHYVKMYQLSVTPTLPSPQPLATTRLLSVSMDLPILGISYVQNHIICGLLCLAAFTWHDVFKVHLCCMMY